jgi:hypothetical protein
MMTKLLTDAFEKVSQLPEDDQDAIAEWLLEELQSERSWDQLFERSADELGALASEALAEHRAGLTRPLSEADF